MNEMTKKYETENWDMQQLMNITGQTAMNLNNMGKQLGIVTTAVNGLTDDVNIIKAKIEKIEFNEEITTDQNNAIIETAKKRVCQIIGGDAFEIKKYFRIFVMRLYTDARKYAGLGSKISRTRKGAFQRCINYIEAWIPSCGCAKLKSEADEKAEAKRKAKSLGYDV